MTQKTVTLLIGLPGSGKSYFLKNYANADNINIFDDISQTDPSLKSLTQSLHNQQITDIYIADVNFLQQGVIEKAQQKLNDIIGSDILFKYIIFLGNKELCTNNVNFRQDGRKVNGTIERFASRINVIHDKYIHDKNAQFIVVQDYAKYAINTKKKHK